MVVKIHLRFIQIAINSVTIVLGITACIAQGTVSSYFQSQCVLNAKLSLILKNTTITVRATDTIWGDSSTCNFTTFTAAFAAIHAFIWCWFFLLMRGSLKEDGKEMSILLPSVILHFVVFIVMLVASIMLTIGSVNFCKHVESTLKHRYTCAQAEELTWGIFGEEHHFYTYLLAAKVSVWLMVISVLLQCVTAGYGIFKILKPSTETFDTESIQKSQASHSLYSLPDQDDSSGSVVFMSSSEGINRGSSAGKSKITDKGQRKQTKSKKKDQIPQAKVDAETDQSEKLLEV